MMMATSLIDNEAQSFIPISVETGEPAPLAMQQILLSGEILPVGARLTVRHVFRCAGDEPIEVVYVFALPKDGALHRFRIAGEDFSMESELHKKEEATARYEEGVERGSLSAMAKCYRDGLVNLSIGNVRSGETVSIYLEMVGGVTLDNDGFRFRFPFTLAPVYHSQAHYGCDEQGQGYMELPEDRFDDLLLPPWREDAGMLHRVGFSLKVRAGLPILSLTSPSHPVRFQPDGADACRVMLATEGDAPNRDLVLDVRMEQDKPAVLAGPDSTGVTRYAVHIPVRGLLHNQQPSKRRVVFLVDRSGSMAGSDFDQARSGVLACIGALDEADSFGIVLFDDDVVPLDKILLPATAENRTKASSFLRGAEVNGGTELLTGIQSAAGVLGDKDGDILLITDGQVGDIGPILQGIKQSKARLHCLGVGAASQDRTLAALASAGGGMSRFVTVGEGLAQSALVMFSSLAMGRIKDIKMIHPDGAGEITVKPEMSSYSTEALLAMGILSKSEAVLDLQWRNGEGTHSLSIPISAPNTEVGVGETIRLVEGGKLIQSLEQEIDQLGAENIWVKRTRKRLVARLCALSEQYQLASEEMSLVAVHKRADDNPNTVPRTQVVTLGMPSDTSFGAYFGANPAFMVTSSPSHGIAESPMEDSGVCCSFEPEPLMQEWVGSSMASITEKASPRSLSIPVDVRLAGMIESDGGMPGADIGERAALSVLVLIILKGNQDAYSMHIARLSNFLESCVQQISMDEAPSWVSIVRWLLGNPEWRLNDDEIREDFDRYALLISIGVFSSPCRIWDDLNRVRAR